MKRIIYSNYNLWDYSNNVKEFLMEEYPERFADSEPTENDIWDELYFEDELNWDEAFGELKHFFKGETVIMTGSVGRWNSTYAGGDIGNFEDLFYSFVKDCDYIEFVDEDGHLYLNCTHHDGQNCAELKILTGKGRDFASNWEYGYGDKRYDFSEQELHKRITSCSFLSRLPRFWENIYGK